MSGQADGRGGRMSAIDAARLQRAIWLDCRPVGLGGFLVRGGKDDHIVDVDGGHIRCDCFDAQVHGDGCRHSLLVRLLGGDPEVVRAVRQLVPAPGRSVRVA